MTSTEIEIRAVLDNPLQAQAKLRELGFADSPPFEQHDIMMDRPDGSLFRSGQKIRIRVEKGQAELTYKGLFQGDASASRRTETNLKIDPVQLPACMTLFEALGYPMLFQIRKERLIFKKSPLKVSFDHWPIIGCLVEIEGAEEEAKKLASAIAPGILFKNYRLKELLADAEKKTGKTLAELKADYQSRTGFDLGKIELLAG